jgi:hypothetical protein
VGCDGGDLGSPRRAWHTTLDLHIARDYGRLWDILAEQSRRDTIRVFEHVRRAPDYRSSMEKKFKIRPASLDRMSARDFFIALMNASDRTVPQVAAARIKNFQNARFGGQEIKADKAVVVWRSGDGPVQRMLFVFQGGEWKPIIQRQ